MVKPDLRVRYFSFWRSQTRQGFFSAFLEQYRFTETWRSLVCVWSFAVVSGLTELVTSCFLQFEGMQMDEAVTQQLHVLRREMKQLQAEATKPTALNIIETAVHLENFIT